MKTFIEFLQVVLWITWSAKPGKCKRQNILQKICFCKVERWRSTRSWQNMWWGSSTLGIFIQWLPACVHFLSCIFYLWTGAGNIQFCQMLPRSFLYFLEMNWFNILQNMVYIALVILNLVFEGKTLISMVGVHQRWPLADSLLCLAWECAFSAIHQGTPACPAGTPSQSHLNCSSSHPTLVFPFSPDHYCA